MSRCRGCLSLAPASELAGGDGKGVFHGEYSKPAGGSRMLYFSLVEALLIESLREAIVLIEVVNGHE